MHPVRNCGFRGTLTHVVRQSGRVTESTVIAEVQAGWAEKHLTFLCKKEPVDLLGTDGKEETEQVQQQNQVSGLVRLYACGWAEQAVVQAAGRPAGGTLQCRGSNSRLAPSGRLDRRTPFIRPFSLLQWRWHFVGGPPSWNATHVGRPTLLPRRPGLRGWPALACLPAHLTFSS